MISSFLPNSEKKFQKSEFFYFANEVSEGQLLQIKSIPTVCGVPSSEVSEVQLEQTK